MGGTIGASTLPAGGTAATTAYPSSVTTDAKGRVTAIVAVSAPPPSSFVTAVNNTGATIAANAAVSADGAGGVKLADSGAVNDFPVIGFTTAAILNTASGSIQSSGAMSGFSGLTVAARYFSDPNTHGGISTLPSFAANQKYQIVGSAINSTTLVLGIYGRTKMGVTGVTQTNFLAMSGSIMIETAVAVTPANNLGAVALQAATPGTQQASANINISGKLITGGMLRQSAMLAG